MPANDVVVKRPEGLYCPQGDFYIDPWRPVARAVITHGHGDHARRGMGEYHCSSACLPILEWRLGAQTYFSYAHGETFQLGDARISLHPAGHVLGSVQVRIEADEQVWVVSGDYKRQPDPSCAPFEVVPCDVFITEATFSLPIYHWPDTVEVVQDILAWRDGCRERGETAVLLCYGLGKAQRILAEIAPFSRDTVLLHGAIVKGVQIYRDAGIDMPPTQPASEVPKATPTAGTLVLAPPSAAGASWIRRFGHYQTAFASGWMQVRGNRRRRNHSRGFVLSDHADWAALLDTIHATGAQRIIATHGNTDALVRFLRESGVAAEAFQTEYGDEEGQE